MNVERSRAEEMVDCLESLDSEFESGPIFDYQFYFMYLFRSHADGRRSPSRLPMRPILQLSPILVFRYMASANAQNARLVIRLINFLAANEGSNR